MPPPWMVCAQRSTKKDGTARWTVDIEGTIADAHLEEYSVLLRDPVVSAPRASFQNSYAQPVAVSMGGTLASVDVTDLRSGDYELLLEARDVSGGSVCAGGGLVHINRGLSLDGIAAVPSLFSPDGDGYLDAANVSFSLS